MPSPASRSLQVGVCTEVQCAGEFAAVATTAAAAAAVAVAALLLLLLLIDLKNEVVSHIAFNRWS
jgi:hypothetical protein